MNRIAQFVSIGTEDDLSGNEKQSEPADKFSVSLQPAFGRSGSNLGAGFLFSIQALLGDQFKVAPDIVSQEHQLKEGGLGVELGRGDGIQSLAFDLSDEVFHIGAAVIDTDGFVGGGFQVGAKHPMGKAVFIKKWLLSVFRICFFGNAHGDETAG